MQSSNEHVTQIRIFSPDKSLLFISSSKGTIYTVDIFDIFREFKKNTRLVYQLQGPGLLTEKIDPKDKHKGRKEKIVDFCVDWDNKPFWRLVVLYESGKLSYFLNSKENSLKISQQLLMARFV